MRIERRRIGNDVTLTWKLTTNGERTSLAGRDLKVTCMDAFNAAVPVEWTVSGMDIVATVRGKNQRTTGVYILKLIENDGKNDQHVVDVQGVELVDHSWKLDDTQTGDVIATSDIEVSLSVEEIVRLKEALVAEAARATAEAERVGAEAARANAETTRQTNEQTRESNEGGRQQNETNREAAETLRATAETARATAEAERVGAEAARANAETTRQTNEQTRESNEGGRQQNETNREAAETLRATAETARATAETLRAAAETTRQTNEQTRESNEGGRQQNETNREAAFASLETQMQTAITNIDTATVKTTPQSFTDAQRAQVGKNLGDDALMAGSEKLVQGGAVFGALNEKNEITGFATANYGINANGTFTTSTTYKHGVIPVASGEVYAIENYDESVDNVRYAFVTTDAASKGGTVPVVTGTDTGIVNHQTTAYVTIPEGCSYLIFNATGNYNSKLYGYNSLLATDNTPTAGSTKKITSGGVEKELPTFILSGAGNTYVKSSVYDKIKAGNTYRLWIKNPDVAMDDVSESRASYTRFSVSWWDAEETAASIFAVYCDTIGDPTNPNPLADYYDITVPNGAVAISMGGRVGTGAELVCMLEDITYITAVDADLQGTKSEGLEWEFYPFRHKFMAYINSSNQTVIKTSGSPMIEYIPVVKGDWIKIILELPSDSVYSPTDITVFKCSSNPAFAGVSVTPVKIYTSATAIISGTETILYIAEEDGYLGVAMLYTTVYKRSYYKLVDRNDLHSLEPETRTFTLTTGSGISIDETDPTNLGAVKTGIASSYGTTEGNVFLDVSDVKYIRLRGNNTTASTYYVNGIGGAFYDAAGDFLSIAYSTGHSAVSTAGFIYIEVPSNAKYFRPTLSSAHPYVTFFREATKNTIKNVAKGLDWQLSTLRYVRQLACTTGKTFGFHENFAIHYAPCKAGEILKIDVTRTNSSYVHIGFCTEKPAKGVAVSGFFRRVSGVQIIEAPFDGYVFASLVAAYETAFLYRVKPDVDERYKHVVPGASWTASKAIDCNEDNDTYGTEVAITTSKYGVSNYIDISNYQFIAVLGVYSTASNATRDASSGTNRVYGSMFYDENKQPLQVVNSMAWSYSWLSGYEVMAVPTGAKYLRVYTYIAGSDTYKTIFGWNRDNDAVDVSTYEGQKYFEEVSDRQVTEAQVIGLTSLTHTVDNEGWEVVDTLQVLNAQKKAEQLINIRWTPKWNVPSKRGADNIYPAGVEVTTGIPYSSNNDDGQKVVGTEVSFHTFMTAINNPYSLMYTECVNRMTSVQAPATKTYWGKSYVNSGNGYAYMGTVCCGLTSSVEACPIKWNNTVMNRYVKTNGLYIPISPIGTVNYDLLQIGDVFDNNAHSFMIYGLHRDSNGRIDRVKIAESTSGYSRGGCRTVVYYPAWTGASSSVFEDYINRSGDPFLHLRYIKLWENTKYTPSPYVPLTARGETAETVTYNDAICTFAGDEATFRVGDLVVVNYNLNGTQPYTWTKIQVYKDDVLLNEYTLTDAEQTLTDYLTNNNITPDPFNASLTENNHALVLGTALEAGLYKACMSDGTNISEYTKWQVISNSLTINQVGEDAYEVTVNGAGTLRSIFINSMYYLPSFDEQRAKKFIIHPYTMAEIWGQTYDSYSVGVRLEGTYGMCTTVPVMFIGSVPEPEEPDDEDD